MPFTVFLTADAAGDLEGIYDYIALHDVPGKSEHVLASIEKILSGLSESPERSTYPKELLALGIRDYREIFFKPYRVIYLVTGAYQLHYPCCRSIHHLLSCINAKSMSLT